MISLSVLNTATMPTIGHFNWKGGVDKGFSPLSAKQSEESILTLLIEVNNLKKTYADKDILSDISLTVKEQEVFGVYGPNGSGKTTLIKILSNLVSPDEGTVAYKKNIITDMVLEGSRNFYWNLTGYQNLNYFATLFNVKEKKSKIADLIDLFGMDEYINRLSGSYSRGMQQKLSLALSLMTEPDVLFLDEPTNGLDEDAVTHLISVLKHLNETTGLTIGVISHDFNLIKKLADRQIMLVDGRINYDKAKEDIM